MREKGIAVCLRLNLEGHRHIASSAPDRPLSLCLSRGVYVDIKPYGFTNYYKVYKFTAIPFAFLGHFGAGAGPARPRGPAAARAGRGVSLGGRRGPPRAVDPTTTRPYGFSLYTSTLRFFPGLSPAVLPCLHGTRFMWMRYGLGLAARAAQVRGTGEVSFQCRSTAQRRSPIEVRGRLLELRC